jgi:hypothetical protein
MHRVLAGLFAIALFASADNSSNVVATASSPQPFTLDGHPVTSNGVASWPLVAGDQIATSDTPVLITLSDGTELLVKANSKIKITVIDHKIQVVVLGGSIDNDWGKHHHWCWVEPAHEASKHHCGDGDHDRDDRCCHANAGW